MKYLRIINGLLLAFCASMGLLLAVVCLIFVFYLDDPTVRRQLPLLLWSTGIFTGLGALCLLGFVALLRRRPWWPLSQLALVAAGAPAIFLLVRLFG